MTNTVDTQVQLAEFTLATVKQHLAQRILSKREVLGYKRDSHMANDHEIPVSMISKVRSGRYEALSIDALVKILILLGDQVDTSTTRFTV